MRRVMKAVRGMQEMGRCNPWETALKNKGVQEDWQITEDSIFQIQEQFKNMYFSKAFNMVCLCPSWDVTSWLTIDD